MIWSHEKCPDDNLFASLPIKDEAIKNWLAIIFFLGTFINIKLDCLFRNQYTSWVKMFKLKIKVCNLYAELTQLIATRKYWMKLMLILVHVLISQEWFDFLLLISLTRSLISYKIEFNSFFKWLVMDIVLYTNPVKLKSYLRNFDIF